jgi:hypothetical protein
VVVVARRRHLGLVTGAALDLGICRRTGPLGPLEVQIAAPHELVFDVIIVPFADPET